MFGKCRQRVRRRGLVVLSNNFQADKFSNENRRTNEQEVILEQITKFFKDNFKKTDVQKISPVFVERIRDNRPYVKVKLFDRNLVALLDSGANNSIVGKGGLGILDLFDIKIKKPAHMSVTTADGVHQPVQGTVDLPLCVNDTCKIIPSLIVPSLKHDFILGSDFCRKFRINIDFNNNSWHVRDDNNVNISTLETENCLSNHYIFTAMNFSEEQLSQVEGVTSKFKALNRDGKLGRTNKLIHHIDTGDARPIKQRQYLLSPYMLGHLNRELDKMLELGVVEPSMSEWSSPVLLVKKSNGDYRFCFDGRKLNAVTKKDSYPLPFVDRILNMLRDARYISSIDLRSAFWQIPLDQESKEKTAFAVTGRGLFHFNVLPFGLSNAAQCQQRLMDAICGPELEPNIFVYLDDVIVVSSTFEKHIDLLNEVARRLNEANLTVNIDKCEFFRPSLKYLGFIVDKSGLRTNPEKVSAMVNFPQPRTTTEIKRFTGMCSWYRRFIPHFSDLMSPINSLLAGRKKGQRIIWSKAAEKAFCDVKQALVSAPILTSPNFDLPFTIQCDASDTGLGCVLAQEQNGQEKVIAFASRSLSKSERNYSCTERECLAVVFGCEKFKPYVLGARFTVITDHASLKWLHKMRDPSGKLARWSVRLNQFDFNIVHRKGKFNVVPDALSRGPVDPPPVESEYLEDAVVNADECITLDIDLSNVDSFYEKMREKIISRPDDFPQWTVKNRYVYKLIPSKTPIATNISEWKLLVPKKQRLSILRSCHDDEKAAHLGVAKTTARTSLTYYWPKMRRDIYRYVRSCKTCNAQKAPTTARFGLMGAEKKVRFPWQVISVDLMGPLPKSSKGHSYLLVVSDWFTKYTLLHPLRKATAASVVRYLEDQVFLVYGIPQYVICDNGTQLISTLFKNLVKEYRSKIWYTAKYHAQANFVERSNRTIGAAIRSYIQKDHKYWDRNISKIGFALRTAKHEVTGYSPAFLNFGRVLPATGDYYGNISFDELQQGNPTCYAQDLGKLREIYHDVQAKLNMAYKRNAHYYNLRKRDVEFFVGDKVWKKNKVLSDAAQNFAQKLAPRYVLCTIRKKISKLVYTLENEDGSDVGNWHVKDLKPYFGSIPDLEESDDSERE